MELQDYLRIVRKRWMTIVITTLVVVGLAAAVTALQTKQYASSTQFFVSTADSFFPPRCRSLSITGC